MNIIASMTMHDESMRYVLTYGTSCDSVAEARKHNDFAVYNDSSIHTEHIIAHYGHKTRACVAVEIFGALYGLTEKNFRR